MTTHEVRTLAAPTEICPETRSAARPDARSGRRLFVWSIRAASVCLIGVAATVGGWRLAAVSNAAPAPTMVGEYTINARPAANVGPLTTELRDDQVVAGSVAEWTTGLWSAARRGDEKSVRSALQELPAGANEEMAARLRETVELLDRHRLEAAAAVAEQRRETLEEIETAAGKGKLSQALASAMALQAITDDWEAELATPQLAELVDEAERKAKTARAEGDLLLAQEMFARLRLLHEGVDAPERTELHQEGLEEVNRRIGLIAHYAPKRLHELRREQMARLQPEREFPEFNAVGLDDWREQSSGITQPMLLRAMRTAASEHIGDDGWKPLLVGGLESMRIFATTPDLVESFPTLNDKARVARWIAIVDDLMEKIASQPARAVSLGDYRRTIEALMRANPATLDVPESVLFREFGDGAALKLAQIFEDNYTEMIWPERLRRFEQQTEGNFVGVGIMIRQNERREIIVVHPLEGSPAFRAGVQAEDRVVSVDGVSTFGWSLNKAVDTITGPRGKVVRLGVARGPEDEESEILELPIERDTIKIRSVNGWHKTGLDPDGNPEWDWMIDPVGHIGYIRLTGFNDESFGDFLDAIDAMEAGGGLNGLILDLRNNPGGLLRSAVQFSNLFIPRGTIVVGENKDGQIVWRQQAQPHRIDARLTSLPIVVLINQASASASEIVAGAMQAHGAAIVVGDRTFGKGSVQTVHDISDGRARAAIKLTTQHYVLPGRDGGPGRIVHRHPGADDWGVNPDLLVRMTPTQMEAAFRVRQEADLLANTVANPNANGNENGNGEADEIDRPHPTTLLTEGHDPQLQTALMILQARALGSGAAPAAAVRR